MIHHKHLHRKIHRKLEKHSPEVVKKAKKIFSFKYIKLFFMAAMIAFAYFFFSRPFMKDVIGQFSGLGEFGFLLSGALTSVGFTAPFGIGLLTSLISKNILIAALIGGLGATLVDLVIFKTVKFSFMDEFKELEKTKVIREIKSIVRKNKRVKAIHYLMYIFAGILLATPLPDELGISMFAGLTTIKPFQLSLLCFFLHSLFIFFILVL